MGLLDRLADFREGQEKKRRAAEARARRNISKAAADRKARERRVKRANTKGRLEAIDSAGFQLGAATRAAIEARTAKRRAKSQTPKGEKSRLRKVLEAAGSGASAVAKTALEAEADARDSRGDAAGAVAARAEDLATAGSPIRGATADPRPGETIERMATAPLAGGLVLDEESHGVEESGEFWENFVMGTDDRGDLDGDGEPERGPLDFDDPLGVTGGLE